MTHALLFIGERPGACLSITLASCDGRVFDMVGPPRSRSKRRVRARSPHRSGLSVAAFTGSPRAPTHLRGYARVVAGFGSSAFPPSDYPYGHQGRPSPVMHGRSQVTDAIPLPERRSVGWYPVGEQAYRYWSGTEWWDQTFSRETSFSPNQHSQSSDGSSRTEGAPSQAFASPWYARCVAFVLGRQRPGATNSR